MKRKSPKLHWMENNIFFAISISLAILFMLFPVLMSFPAINDCLTDILDSLHGDWIGDYISAFGAAIGSMLALTSAVWLQNRSKRKQDYENVQKHAAIVYYDIKMFYTEMNASIKLLKSAPSTASGINEILNKIHGIYINSNWIKDVAELVGAFDRSGLPIDIEKIYAFYGAVSELHRFLELRSPAATLQADTLDPLLDSLGHVDDGSFIPTNNIRKILNDMMNLADIHDSITFPSEENKSPKVADQIKHAGDTLGKLHNQIAMYDNKAAIIFALISALLVMLCGTDGINAIIYATEFGDPLLCLLSLSTLSIIGSILVLIGVVCLLSCIIARLRKHKRNPHAPLYCEDIADYPTIYRFSNAFKNMTQSDYLDELLAQNHINASIATRKGIRCNLGIICSVIGLMILFALRLHGQILMISHGLI